MSDDDTPCRWHLIDIGGFRPAHYCATHDAWRHRFACFDETGLVDCVCGIATSRSRPSPLVLQEQVA